MKKVLILCLVFLFAGVGAAFAATPYPGSGFQTDSFDVGGTSSLTVKTSKNVYMQVSIATTGSGSSTIAVNYTVGSYHNAGSRTFATSNADQKLFFFEGTGQGIEDAPGNAGAAPDWIGNSWKVL